MHNIKSHEYSLGELLSHSWKLYKNNFWLFVVIFLIIYIPIDILSFFAPGTVVNIITFIATPIPVMAIAYAVNKILKKQKVTYGRALNEAFSKLFWALGTTILEAILLFGLLLLLVVPAIIYSVYWMFYLYPIILHNQYGGKALSYSESVVKGRWWKVFGFSIVLILLLLTSALLIVLPFIYLYPDIESELLLTPYPLLDILLNSLTYLAFAFFEVIFVVFFINLDNTKLKTVK